MKKLGLILLVCAALMLCVMTGAAEEPITVKVNGAVLESDVPAQLVNDRTMLPMRAVFEALGATVTWIEEDQLVLAVRENTLITMQIGSQNMSISKDGQDSQLVLDAVPFVTNDRTMVPVRAVAEALSAKVDWAEETNTVVITDDYLTK